MASKVTGGTDTVETRDDVVEGVLLDTMTAAVKKLIARGKERGYVTYDELNAALPQDQVLRADRGHPGHAERDRHQRRRERGERGRRGPPSPSPPKDKEEEDEEESGGNVDEESLGRTDDPVRMYLREMGSVELLSREGEIAIAKRIEAGRDMMIGGLCESPQTFKAIIAWHEAVKEGRMLLRDVIDLEATNPADAPDEGAAARRRSEGSSRKAREGEGLGLSLSALEEKLKPEALVAFEAIEGAYTKLQKLQNKRMEAYTAGEDLQARSEKTYEKTRGRAGGAGAEGAPAQQPDRGTGRAAQAPQPQADRAGGAGAPHGRGQQGEAGGVPAELARQRAGPGLVRAAGQADPKSWKTFVARRATIVESVRAQMATIANDTNLPIAEFRRVYMPPSRAASAT